MKRILSLLLCLGTIFSMMVGLCLPVSAENTSNTSWVPYYSNGTTKQMFVYNNAFYRITYNSSLTLGVLDTDSVCLSIDSLGVLSLKISSDGGISSDDYQLYTDQQHVNVANANNIGQTIELYPNFGDVSVQDYPSVSVEHVPFTGTPTWNWTEITSATATFTYPGSTLSTSAMNATITGPVTQNGEYVYTASVTFEGGIYTDTKGVAIPEYTIAATTESSDMGTVGGAGSYDEGSSVTLTASPKTGYEFSGWYENNSLVSNSNPYEFNADRNHSFTAKFAVKQLHITKDDTVVGGSYTVNPSIVDYNGSAMLTAVPDTEHSFSAWEYSADDGNSYTKFGNNAMQFRFSGITSDLIIRPVFTGIPFKVTFDANNGTGTQMATQDFTYNSGAILQKCTYTRTGYTFSGWNTKADGTGTAIGDGADGSTLSADGTNITLYAQWTLTKYTITYDLDGGAMPQGKTNPKEYTVDTPDFTLNNPERIGYNFLGWTGTGVQGRTDKLLIKIGSTGNREYKADWEAKTYDIEFKPGSHGSINGSGGSPLTSYFLSSKYDTDFPVFNTGTSLNGRTLTAEAGYTFAGWRDENGNAPGAKVAGNASYTAQWTANTNTAYTVQFLKSDYDVLRSESKTGTTDAVVDISALVNEFPIPGYHYINNADYYIHSDITTQKPVGQNGVKVMGDGSLVIRLYYTENSFVKLTLAVNNANRGSIQRYSNGFYLAPATGRSEDISVNVVSGCTFEKWVYTDATHSTPTDVPNATGSTLTAAQIDSVAKDTGIYEPVTFTAIITEPTATYNYSVSSAGGGTVTKDTETIDAVTGEAAGSTAVPATGYDFEKWIYTTDGTTASTSAAFVPGKVNGAYAGANYEAVFKKQTFAVNASVTPLETGTVTGTGTFEYGTGTTLTATPAAGYHFSSWSLNGSSAGTNAILTVSNIKEIRNYTAQFEGNQYTIKFNNNFKGSATMNDETFTYGTSKNLTANSFERTSYTFSGWNTRNDGTGASYSDAADIAKINLETVTADNTITLYAQWTPITYTITYTMNSGTNNASNPASYTIESSEITLGTPTREGYTFAGWTGANGTTPQTSVTIASGSTGDKAYTANWTANTYSVVYNGNGNNSGATDASTHTYDAVKALTANGFGRAYTVTYNYNYSGRTNTTDTAAYGFENWNTNAAGTGTTYADGASVTNLATSGTFNLYAQWTPASITLDTPTRTGYTFGGWFTDADCTTSAGAAGTSYTPTENITLYAQWTEKPNVTINYVSANAAMGTVSSAQESIAPVTGTAAGSTAAANTGYHFASWTNQSGVVVSTAAFFKPAQIEGLNVSATYTANFAKNTYTIKFNANGGSKVMADELMTYGETELLTANAFTRAGYHFTGWSTAETGTIAYTDQQAVRNLISDPKPDGSSSITLYAQWAEDANVTIKYQSADTAMGTVSSVSESVAPATGTAKGSIAIANPGYHFASWTDEKGIEVSKNVSYQPAKVKDLNITAAYTANFAPNDYTIKFDGGSGKGTMADQPLTYGVSTKLSKNNFTLTGFSFSGWNTKKDGTGTSYEYAADIAKIALNTVSKDNEIVLYAQWRINPNTSQTRTVLQEGIAEVPDAFKDKPDLDTPAEINTAMRITINNADSTIPAGNIKVYEVKLQFSTDGGKTWIDATKDNFPKEGITFTLKYPDGSNANDDFKITHMFTTGVNAGYTENLSYIKTADGLQVHVTSLSPFAVGYVKKAATPAAPAVKPTSSKPDLWCITYLDCKGNTVSVQWVETGKAPLKPAGYSYPDISNVSAHQDVRPSSCKINTKYVVPNTADKFSITQSVGLLMAMTGMMLSAGVYFSMKSRKN